MADRSGSSEAQDGRRKWGGWDPKWQWGMGVLRPKMAAQRAVLTRKMADKGGNIEAQDGRQGGGC